MSKKNYIKLNRSILTHWIWPTGRAYTETEAWLFLLLNAAHTTHKQRHDNKLLTVYISEYITTAVELAKTWRWDRRTVATFLKTLEEDGMLCTEKCTRVCTRLKINNYNAFQGISEQDCTEQCTDDGTGECTRYAQVDVQVPPLGVSQGAAKGTPIIKGNKDNKYNPHDFETAEWIFSCLLEMNPKHRQPNLESWAETIRLMREQDQRTDAEIRELFQWANQHDFWSTNILSPVKLRKQWDTLTIQKTNSRRNHSANNAYGGETIIV